MALSWNRVCPKPLSFVRPLPFLERFFFNLLSWQVPHLSKAQLKGPFVFEIISEAPLFLGQTFILETATLCAFLMYWSLSLSPYTCAEFQSSLRFILGLKVPVREHDLERMMNELKNIPVLFLIFLSWRKKYSFFPSKLWQRLFLLLFICKGNNLNG